MINDYEATRPMTTDYVPVDQNATNDEVISVLNNLIEVCRDGEQGFKQAAEGVKRSELKSVLYELSIQRSEFAGVLQSLVLSLGGRPETEGTISGALHRGWMNIKAAVAGQDEEAILNECERSEDVAKDSYSDAFDKLLPSDIADVLRQQSHAILAAHNRIKMLRDNASHRTAGQGN